MAGLAAGCAALAALLLLWSGPARGYPMPAEFYKLSEDLVSQHTAWAKPLDGGPVKVLAVAPRGAQRETIELAQRLELDYSYVLAMTPTELGWSANSSSYAPADGISNAEMLDELRGKLSEDYDVIIVGHLDWNVIPTELIYAILKKVHDGAGLVYSYSSFGSGNRWIKDALAHAKPADDAVEAVAAGVPFGALPKLDEWGPEQVLGLREFKQGRIVTLNYQGGAKRGRPRFQYLTPFAPDDVESYEDGHYEYYMSLVIRSVLWAAKREPARRIVKWGEDGAAFRRADLGAATLAVALSGASGAELEAEMTVRRPSGAVVLSRRRAVSAEAAAAGFEFRLDLLPHGRWFADLIIRQDSRSVDWAATYFDVEADVHVTSVQTDRPWYEPGQTIAVEATLSGPAPSGAAVRVDLIDSLGRLMDSTAAGLAADGTSASCVLTLAHPQVITADVRVVLEQDGATVAEAAAPISVVRRKWDDFLFCAWTAGSNFNERVRRLMFDQMLEAGVDTFTNSSRSEVGVRRAARLGFHGIPYMTRYFYGAPDPVRKPCLTNPKFLASHLAGLTEIARIQQPFDPQGYTLGDECFLARPGSDACFSKTCTADLREWLKTEYGSVQALNESWGTTYGSFAEAEPITLEDAQESGQIARWVDHRRHMEFVYTRMMARAKAAIREADPRGRVGFDGPFLTHSSSGDDWWRHMQVFDLCNVYFHEPDQWEAVRSFAKPGTLLGLWYGGYTNQRNEDYSRFFPWRAVLHGYNSVWWYAVFHGLAACPMDALTPSMTWHNYFAASVQELREIKGGVGKALMHAQRLSGGIAVHYSQSSLHAATAYEGLGRLHQTWRDWYAALEDAQLQYDCLAYGRIEEQGVDAARHRVLILPYSQAVSPKEAEAIRDFVRGGGTLVADVRPAVADHHGKLRSPGLLDDVFGIRRADGKLELARNVDGQLTGVLAEALDSVTLPRLTVDPNIVAAGAKSSGTAGETPILLLNQFGAGRAVLLNFALSGYRSCRAKPEAGAYWAVVRAAVGLAGVKPRVQVNGPDGPLYKVESVFFRDGPVEYLGFLKYRAGTTETAVDAEVVLDGEAVTYDVRAGQCLGKVDRFTAAFAPDRGKLYARLPYHVRSVSVRPAVTKAQPGDVVKLGLALETLAATGPGRHWFRVEVFGPEGELRRHYADNVAVVDGVGEATVPLALNDGAGVWRVTARDLASGVSGSAAFEVRPRAGARRRGLFRRALRGLKLGK